MFTPEDLQQYFVDLLGPVCEILHDHLQEASDVAREHLKGYGMAHGYALTHLTRAHLERLLDSDDLPGFQLREPRRNGRLLLGAPGGSTVRILHALPGGGVPPPGRNRARVLYWQQQLRLPLGDMPVSALLALWHADGAGLPYWRIVRPIGRWPYRGKEKIDLDFKLPRSADEMDDLVFQPDDTEVELDLDLGLTLDDEPADLPDLDTP